ncbi:MAG: hypothetical protein J7L26_01255 [Candidatus Aminicenantes bacterium]|nr:hypothetical protein [Candidatus Aminicenantes bacterium]
MWKHFQHRDEEMVAGTLFWPMAFSRKRAKIVPITIFPSPRKNEKEIFCWPPFLSSSLIFIIQAYGYGQSYHRFGNAFMMIWIVLYLMIFSVYVILNINGEEKFNYHFFPVNCYYFIF